MHRALVLTSLLALTVACSGTEESRSLSLQGGRAREASAPRAQEGERGDILPFEATEKTLANGLRVIVVPTGLPNIVSLQIPVQTGSRNEVEEGKTGFAHFFEHMMFRGTPNYPPDAYEAILTKAGARQNAYTTDDYTNYHITFAKEDLEKILEIEADRFQHLSYTEEQFRTEALAVLGEYNKNSSNPFQKLFEVMRKEAYTTHTYEHTTMGFIEDIEAMPDQMEYAKVFFDRWYRPEYATVIVAGDVDAKKVIPLVEKYWSSWKRGSYTVEIPREPEPQGPVYAHVPWTSPTLPIISVAFHGPAFSETKKDSVALDLFLTLNFGETSDLYRKLVVQEQKVDIFGSISAEDEDPALAMVIGRVKDPADAVYVRDQILTTIAKALAEPVDGKRLEEAKSNLRYGFSAGLDTTEAIGSTLARYVRFRRSYHTLNKLFRLYEATTAEDVLAAARKYLTDGRMVVTTLSQADLDPAVKSIPRLASFAPAGEEAGGPQVNFVVQSSPNPQLSLRLAFDVGSANDPEGKEGLAELSASMISAAGSTDLRYEEIQKKLFPVAGWFGNQVDRELTVFAGSIHADNLDLYVETALPQLISPGFREEDFTRLKQNQINALVQDLRTNNDEELGKEVLQAMIFEGSVYGHPTLGTVDGLESITLDDVKDFVARNYTRARLTVGLAGDVTADLQETLRRSIGKLPAGDTRYDDQGPVARTPEGIDVRIVEKETRATAISFGFPIEVKRGHPDFAALYLARTWLGEHRSSMSHLYQRIREVRGMNYGDYAYIEAFPGGGGQFFPDANRPRAQQIFEIWIRPVKPEQAHHALRIAVHELELLVRNGLTQEQFESTREYLSKNVFLMTASQSDQLGYALDSRWYGIGEFTKYMRDGLAKLTLDDVNAAIRKHLQAENLAVVCVTKDAQGLRDQLVSDAPSSIAYESQKTDELLAEDRLIGARKLGLTAGDVEVVPVESVFKN